MSKSSKQRDHEGPYYMIFECYLDSPAYRDLKPPAKALLIEFLRICYPVARNGHLSISVSNASKLLNVSKPTASKAFHDLAEHGFLVLTEGQYWQERKAREWRLTIKSCIGRDPTNEWLRWQAGCPVVEIQKKSSGQKTYPDCSKISTSTGKKTHPEHIRLVKNDDQ